MKLRVTAIFCCLLISAVGCARRPQEKAVVFSVGDIDERAGSCALLRADASEFEKLNLDARIAAYYLHRAVQAGKDIPRSQLEPRQAQGLHFMAKIGANIGYGAPDYLVEPYWKYLKTLWIHNGFYDLRTGKKLPAEIGQREISQRMFVALSNSGGTLGDLTEINQQALILLDTLFSEERYPTLFPQPDSGDVLQGIPQSFYAGLTAAEAAGFNGEHPRNSNWLKQDGRIVEAVYRAGDEELASGPFHAELREVIENLEKARPYLPENRIEAVDDIIRYLRTGNPKSLDSAAARQSESRAQVDFVFGFTDRRFDPLRIKGLWTGILFLLDSTAQGKLDQLYASMPNLLSTFPGTPETRRGFCGVTAGQLLAATSPLFPICPDSYQNPPNGSDGDAAGKCWIFTNILQARAIARAKFIESAFCYDDAEREAALVYAINAAFVRNALELMLGQPPTPPLGMENQIEPDEEDILRSASVDLCVLWLFRDERMQKMRILSDFKVADEAYRAYARRYLLEPLLKEMDAAHRRAVTLICNYLLERGALKLEESETGIYCRLVDAQRMRDQVFELAETLQALQRTGKSGSLQDFVRRYATDPDPSLIEKASGSLAKTGTFTSTAFILPLIQADFNPMGGIENVRQKQPADFADEMLIFEGVRQPDKRK